MAFKISKNIGKVGEFIPIDFSKAEPIFDEDIEIEKEGLYQFDNGYLVLSKGDYMYVYEKTKAK